MRRQKSQHSATNSQPPGHLCLSHTEGSNGNDSDQSHGSMDTGFYKMEVEMEDDDDNNGGDESEEFSDILPPPTGTQKT